MNIVAVERIDELEVTHRSGASFLKIQRRFIWTWSAQHFDMWCLDGTTASARSLNFVTLDTV